MITIKSDKLTAKINELGAELSHLSDKNRNYIFDDMEIWDGHSPVLFPFVGRMPDKKYVYNGKTYEIPLHGFAPYANFEIVEKTESLVKMHLIVTDQIKEMYPFDFDFYATYELKGNVLEETFDVVNNGKETMYYGIGGHPGFNVPIEKSLKFEDYFVEFPDANPHDVKRRLFDDLFLDAQVEIPFEDSLDGNKLHLRHNLFDHDAVIMTNTGSRVIIRTESDDKKIIVDYPDTPYCALWHKIKKEVPYVCIEPWVSLPGHAGENDISKKEDFRSVEPGQRKQHKLIITICA